MRAAAAEDVARVELHGYLDGELSEQRTGEVESFLERERAGAEQIVHYGVQGDLIRRLYGPLINRPMPPEMAGRLQVLSQQSPGVAAKSRKARGIIYLLLVILALGALLWLSHPMLTDAVKALPIGKFISF